MARKKLYSDEELKERKREYNKKYRQEHKDEISKYYSEWRNNNKEYIAKSQSEYRKNNLDKFRIYSKKHTSTKNGRAKMLLRAYNQADKQMGRGECTLTAEWIVENVFNGQKCHYCEETDWTKLGCDRVDNDKPHTPDNVVPCCRKCNERKHTMKYDKFLKINK